jgi:hypothetical protein
VLSRSEHLYRPEAIDYQRKRLAGDVRLEVEAKAHRWLGVLVAAHVGFALLLCIPLPVSVSHAASCRPERGGLIAQTDLVISGVVDVKSVVLTSNNLSTTFGGAGVTLESGRPLRLRLQTASTAAGPAVPCTVNAALTIRPLAMIGARLKQII